MERFKPSFEQLASEDRGVDLSDFTGDAVKREFEYHPELDSLREQLIFVQDTFEWTVIPLKNVLGITETQARHYLKRGIQKKALEKFEQRFRNVFAIASILERQYPEKEDVFLRRNILRKPNPLFEERTAMELLQNGESDRVLAVIERSFRHNKEA